MGSSGIISNVIITPTNQHSQQVSQTNAAIASYPGLHEGVRTTTGVVFEIHPERARLVKAYQLDDGSPIANEQWIELDHSAQEIAERWGTVRIGFKVRVTFKGPAGSSATATIIGAEEQNINEAPIENVAARGLFAIFAPGVGG